MIYIQRKTYDGTPQLETVDEAETAGEALSLVREYQRRDTTAEYYRSIRACDNWKD
ncbi:MAG: hypothetical protein V3T88_09150 [Nitrosomonadaceae bacterium]